MGSKDTDEQCIIPVDKNWGQGYILDKEETADCG
jgi:hypothetical protein